MTFFGSRLLSIGNLEGLMVFEVLPVEGGRSIFQGSFFPFISLWGNEKNFQDLHFSPARPFATPPLPTLFDPNYCPCFAFGRVWGDRWGIA